MRFHFEMPKLTKTNDVDKITHTPRCEVPRTGRAQKGKKRKLIHLIYLLSFVVRKSTKYGQAKDTKSQGLKADCHGRCIHLQQMLCPGARSSHAQSQAPKNKKTRHKEARRQKSELDGALHERDTSHNSRSQVSQELFLDKLVRQLKDYTQVRLTSFTTSVCPR